LWLELAFAPYLLRTLGDGTEMPHGVEGRLPFLDPKVWSLARAIPSSLKIRGRIEKWILKQALRGLVPDEILAREKHPLMAPPLSRFADRECWGVLQDNLRTLGAAGCFDPRAVAAWLERLPLLPEAERAASDPVLMTLLSAAALCDRFSLG
jgi:asparagine synthase (glutamine-hydrolysing)